MAAAAAAAIQKQSVAAAAHSRPLMSSIYREHLAASQSADDFVALSSWGFPLDPASFDGVRFLPCVSKRPFISGASCRLGCEMKTKNKRNMTLNLLLLRLRLSGAPPLFFFPQCAEMPRAAGVGLLASDSAPVPRRPLLQLAVDRRRGRLYIAAPRLLKLERLVDDGGNVFLEVAMCGAQDDDIVL